MTDATITVLAAGVVAIITAVGTVLVAIINAKLSKAAERAAAIEAKTDVAVEKAAAIEAKTDVAVEKAAAIEAKTGVIEAKVDGNLSAATAALAVANETIRGYQTQIEQMTLATKSAHDLALKQAPPAPPTVPLKR